MSHQTKYEHTHHYCFRCLHGFIRDDLLKNHLPYCKKQAAQAITKPEEGENILKFTATHLQHPVPFIIYADFESLIVLITLCIPSNNSSYQTNISSHQPCGYAYVIVNSEGHMVEKLLSIEERTLLNTF